MAVSHRLSSSILSAGVAALLALTIASGGRSGKKESTRQEGAKAPEAQPGKPVEDTLPPPAYESELPVSVRNIIDQPTTGDFDGMATRRIIRAGVTCNRTHYLVEKGI